MAFIVATFYKFVPLSNTQELRSHLLSWGQALNLRGTICLAPEGINGTLAGDQPAIDQMLHQLRQHPVLADITPRTATTPTLPFERFKVKLKPEIVTLGRPEVNPIQQVGTYVSPQDWNALISDPEVLVLDTRNHYEVSIGSFQGAINPATDRFREFPAYVAQLNPTVHKRVAMFCTGGIRCEKASAYLLQQGFEQVYHLQGGILNYLETIPETESLWQGECFVFDDRVAVGHGLQPGIHQMCQGCGHPVSPEDQASPQYLPGHWCPHCL
ncbi:Thiosulfate sulfurtransferase GlpE [Halomicronema hongdechloris C2206]|uniref:tRNA uridine(34) hydroxylase n=1 Tax=Halomicronema hongdechloris C2206 TaxID=1641165 RepID=A0A1Z3HNH5_9CYAN|nr:rhodanese-related sulfurtransferase [Halomicronema hongdechloris]ASC71864.1 Thiosulfate sulfurtransferase GlpE [Halomicronema hongdechloris C2206]